MVSEAKRKSNDKYDAKTYKSFLIRVRVDEDADLIRELEEAKAKGMSYREYLRSLKDGD